MEAEPPQVGRLLATPRMENVPHTTWNYKLLLRLVRKESVKICKPRY
jgi:hypothetical protein